MFKALRIYCVLFVVTCISICHALECYVCTEQEGNTEKCLNTIKPCEQGQDRCFTEVKWGSTPYWSPGAKKQYYVSKRCSTKKECERIRSSNMPLCTYVWYLDWKCSECCAGDKCNYYIISGTNKIKVSYRMATLVAFISLLFWR